MLGFLKALLLPWAYLVLSAAISAILSYPLYLMFGEGDISFFRSLVSRMGQAILLLGLVPVVFNGRFKAADFGIGSHWGSGWIQGFLIGMLMLSLHGLLLISLKIRSLDIPEVAWIHYFKAILSALSSGIGVAFLEEILFRGALLWVLLRLTTPTLAVLLCAFDFSILHFIGSQWTTDPAMVGMDTGFRIALDGLSQIPKADPGSFLALFSAGLFLALSRLRTASGLFFCMGIHAGWVSVIKILKSLTVLNHASVLLPLVGRYDSVIGFLSSSWLLPLIALWLLVDRRKQVRGDQHVA